MQNWIKSFEDKDIFFVTTDVKRGIGFDGLLPRYHIICIYKDPLIDILRRQGANIFCLQEHINLDEDNVNNSGRLLQHRLVQKYIAGNSKEIPYILYFKPSQKIDILIQELKYNPIGNPSRIGKLFEDKIRFQYIIQTNIPKHTIPSAIGKLEEFSFKEMEKKFGLPFVIQFGFGWAGKTTFFISNEQKYNELSRVYKFTPAKVSKKIHGFTVLNNCCIHNSQVLVGPPAIQIGNISDLYENPSVTCGRQWPVNFLEKSQVQLIQGLSLQIGHLMQIEKYKGYFGIDFLIDSSNGQIYISEVNARLTASSAFYTRLERERGVIPLLAYHIGEFMDVKFDPHMMSPTDLKGSQIILRSKEKTPLMSIEDNFGVYQLSLEKFTKIGSDYFPEKLNDNECIYIKNGLTNTKDVGGELARIETKDQVLESPILLKSAYRIFIKNGYHLDLIK